MEYEYVEFYYDKNMILKSARRKIEFLSRKFYKIFYDGIDKM